MTQACLLDIALLYPMVGVITAQEQVWQRLGMMYAAHMACTQSIVYKDLIVTLRYAYGVLGVRFCQLMPGCSSAHASGACLPVTLKDWRREDVSIGSRNFLQEKAGSWQQRSRAISGASSRACWPPRRALTWLPTATTASKPPRWSKYVTAPFIYTHDLLGGYTPFGRHSNYSAGASMRSREAQAAAVTLRAACVLVAMVSAHCWQAAGHLIMEALMCASRLPRSSCNHRTCCLKVLSLQVLPCFSTSGLNIPRIYFNCKSSPPRSRVRESTRALLMCCNSGPFPCPS